MRLQFIMRNPQSMTSKGKQMANQIDLSQLFGQVAQALVQNRSALNQADSYNQNHGDNMAEIFQLITKALEEKKDAKPAVQLKYAAKQIGKVKSGSAQVYAKGLARAAKDVKGNAIDTGNVMQLVLDLIAGGKKVNPSPKAGDPLSDILSSLMGAGQQAIGDEKLDAGDLLTAGLAFLSAKQSGEDTMGAAVKALVAASPLSQAPHREQSGQVVLDTLLKTIGTMAQRK
jgi:hypothetical protein